MNNPLNTVLVLLCCVLLVSSPLGFVAPASAASPAPEHHVDFCDPSSYSHYEIEEAMGAAEEVMSFLPRWYQDVARSNTILVRVYDGPETQMWDLVVRNDYIDEMLFQVGDNYQINLVTRNFFDGVATEDVDIEAFAEGPTLVVHADCNALTRIYTSDDKRNETVDALWEGDIVYRGNGPGADAAVVYSESLLTGAHILEQRQSANPGDFFLGTLAPVTKTSAELDRLLTWGYTESGEALRTIKEYRRGGL